EDRVVRGDERRAPEPSPEGRRPRGHLRGRPRWRKGRGSPEVCRLGGFLSGLGCEPTVSPSTDEDRGQVIVELVPTLFLGLDRLPVDGHGVDGRKTGHFTPTYVPTHHSVAYLTYGTACRVSTRAC